MLLAFSFIQTNMYKLCFVLKLNCDVSLWNYHLLLYYIIDNEKSGRKGEK